MRRSGINRILNESLKLAFRGVYYGVRALTGTRISIATNYSEFSRIVANFPAPIDSIQAIMPSDRLRPIEYTPGKTLVSLAASEMRRIDLLNPYNEFGICVPSVYETGDEGLELPGIYVFSMPVTTEGARWGGVEIYGYPKFIAEITFHDDEGVHSCRVRADGKDIATIRATELPTKYQAKDEYYFTTRDNELIRTLFRVEGHIGTTDVQGGASFSLGEHPLADELRKLSIDQASASHEYISQAQALLHRPGEPLKL